mmetsp:Transcript_62205/g.148404  ORF Transcript_62205/g.148404 Transcript_62205/m.148404 type:complete len:197 (+) Transcript_62205:137-727(+)|eukprot:CAMPEP_0178428214 /NCGR_PEP_ID=MMETSP0689_2-20121128/30159_1 /TAXON_ID=160604 /ORGANISM="Amphidinium massartii, Strain CS-259" /LENGTH=196 /DNA_ID=CAMNT_0020049973 /DNA_START=131 /DNA_END=721 /DNA_ORIENTATION=-
MFGDPGVGSAHGRDDSAWQKEAFAAVAQVGYGNALQQAQSTGQMLQEYIRRGPDGIGWLCWIGGFLTFVLGLLSLTDIFEVFVSPLGYLISTYQMVFGLLTCIIEAPDRWTQANPKLLQAQEFTHDYLKFLTTLGGRGGFYIFQGSLSLDLSGISVFSLLAIYMFCMGILCIGMQLGLVPQMNIRAAQQEDYIQVH